MSEKILILFGNTEKRMISFVFALDYMYLCNHANGKDDGKATHSGGVGEV